MPRNRHAWGFMLFASVLMIPGTAGLRQTKPAPKTYTVLITGFKFVPEKLEVNPGDKVTWKNEDIVPHTVTGKTFDSKSLEKGASWTLVTSESGSFPYRCRFHPTMTGVLIVK